MPGILPMEQELDLYKPVACDGLPQEAPLADVASQGTLNKPYL